MSSSSAKRRRVIGTASASEVEQLRAEVAALRDSMFLAISTIDLRLRQVDILFESVHRRITNVRNERGA